MIPIYDPILQDLRSGEALIDTEIEMVAPGNTEKDENGNWKFEILTNNNLVLKVRRAGVWVTTEIIGEY